jgi:hypothetical protein
MPSVLTAQILNNSSLTKRLDISDRIADIAISIDANEAFWEQPSFL